MLNALRSKLIAAFWLTASATLPLCGFGQQPSSTSAPPAEKPAKAAAPDAPTPAATPPVSQAQISTWLAQLDDRQYRVRERATQQLLAAGQPALEPLAAVANGDRPEPADRAVWLMQQFGNSKDQPFRRAALERLVLLKDRPQVVASANEALSVIRFQESKLAIEQLGGRFVTPEIPGIETRAIPVPLILDEHWKGNSEDLARLSQTMGLRQVFIIGTDLSADEMAELRQVTTLDELHLYGTRVEPNELDALKGQLPQAAVDYRRGGLLGVTGTRIDDGSPAVANDVQAGSAAAQAGIQAGDVIRRFDGKDVPNFKGLTEMISKHRAGDEVAIEVLRNGATKKLTVKLGQWSADSVIKQLNPSR